MTLPNRPPHRPVAAVLLGGGSAAMLDIVYAFIRNGQHGHTPLWVLQSVASGWTGAGAFHSGVAGGLLGLASHFAILLVAAAVYLAASRYLGVLRSKALLCGALFGVLVYLFMNFVVVPLSAFPYRLAYPLPRLLEGFFAHAVLVGLPIALSVRRLTQAKTAPADL